VFLFTSSTDPEDSNTYDIDVELSIQLKKNNYVQTEAIRKALYSSFTLIQGPPGKCSTPVVYLYIQHFCHVDSQNINNYFLKYYDFKQTLN